ncbi:hypothetical protein JG678_00510 [Campylobacter sp. 2018MI35]|uniref:Uncharacterized protein n=1 Tax=Campylobacter aviculae TaxID=2510190 RepID=A0A4U7BLA7_9BACT|nr:MULTISPECIES: hypothetical protein [Campylobacter]MBK1999929.1 hypothetical protein [Campylobacter sp. 2018MI35]TKX32419.1 hypothetical protein CQA76_03595 [Campylobacter aviculae]HEG0602258.1 hypothetical protein [Campylobacter jejuni]
MSFKPIQKNNKALEYANRAKLIEKLAMRGYALVKISSNGFIMKKGFEKDILCNTAQDTIASTLLSQKQPFTNTLKSGDCLKKCEVQQETKVSMNL